MPRGEQDTAQATSALSLDEVLAKRAVELGGLYAKLLCGAGRLQSLKLHLTKVVHTSVLSLVAFSQTIPVKDQLKSYAASPLLPGLERVEVPIKSKTLLSKPGLDRGNAKGVAERRF
ncbi:hypothetical protein JCM10207_004248 [Rhodosporidiobolus poonsookiae]